MEQFLRRLEKLGLELGDEDIADVVWLAMQIGSVAAVEIQPEPAEPEPPGEVEPAKSGQSTEQTTPSTAPQRQPTTVSAFASDSVSRPPDFKTSTAGLPFQAPAVTALPNALDLGRALRPLMRKVPSATQFVLDSEATVNRVIEQQIWQPVLLPAPERWLDLELVVEESPLNLVWQQTLDELRRKVLERSGVFRHVRSWTLRDQDSRPQLLSRYAGEIGARMGSPQELVHPSGRGLVMVISDGQSDLWQSSQLQPDANQSEPPAPNLHAWLHYWASHGPTVMVQLLPKWMWERSTLDFGTPAQLMSIFPGAANQQWSAMGLSSRQRRRMDEEPPLKLPVVTLEANSLQTWATVVAAAGITPTPGFVFNLSDLKQYQQGAKETPSRLTEISDEALLDRFLVTASSTAQQLAGMMAAVPVSVPVIHLLQAHFLPKSTPIHVAEVFMSGLLHQTGTHEKTHQLIYDFKTPDVRRLLNQAFPDYKTHQVVRVLSEAIANRLGRNDLNSFAAFLSLDPEVLELGDDDQERIVHRFAALLPEVLRNLGGAYATLADTAELLEGQPKLMEMEPSDSLLEFPNIPALEDFDYVTPVVRFEDDRENAFESDIGLTSDVKTVEVATITIAPSTSDSISEAQAYSALEQNLADIKQQIIKDFEGRELDFQVNKHPEDIQVEGIDERQISLSSTHTPDVEILNTELEGTEEGVATFFLLVKISFTAEVSYFNHEAYIPEIHDGDVPHTIQEWTGQTVDGRVQVYLSFSEEDETDVEITGVELELESPIQLREPDRPTSVETAPSEELELFEIHIKTVEKIEGEWVALSATSAAHSYIESLSKGIDLEMVVIPGGEFQMGSPDDEPERNNDETPQHPVTIPGFFMGRYPVTQAQWRVVAALPREMRDLEPDPSHFNGDDCPIEQVNWDDAVEFCARLSRHTEREYRLPSEAEWEYACRAGTTTPFHFGEMITTEVANYDGSAYADGPKGESRGGTTPVNEFGIANAFGLSDMHGNVYEWCLDHWHDNYEGAPTDGSAWISENDRASRVRRGGSWRSYPWHCRSADRLHSTSVSTNGGIGFRVVVVLR